MLNKIALALFLGVLAAPGATAQGAISEGVIGAEAEPGYTRIHVPGGRSMICGQAPLYVLDGDALGADRLHLLQGLLPGDIETIAVLKDEEAVARYGPAGANGVVFIATKADSRAATQPTSTELSERLPGAFHVHTPYPNPASGPVSISVDLPQEAEVTLSVFDARGRQVWTSAPALYAPGPGHRLMLDTSGLSAGTYVYRVDARAAGQTDTSTGTFTLVR